MARNVKKKNPEPQLCQPAEIFAALQMLEKERGIPVDYMVDRIKQALINAYRKDREDHKEIAAENVEVVLTESAMSMVQQRTVVEEVGNPAGEIALDAARNTAPHAQPGDVIRIPVKIENFGRIAAQTAKQVIITTTIPLRPRRFSLAPSCGLTPPGATCLSGSAPARSAPTPSCGPVSRSPARSTRRAT